MKKLFILIFLLLLISQVSSFVISNPQEIPINNSIKNNTDEQINCSDFKWVEDLSKKVYSNGNTSLQAQTLIEILKQTNYILQDNLNKCEERLSRAPNIYFLYISISLAAILTLWKIYDLLIIFRNN